jgi:hypothetical protein
MLGCQGSFGKVHRGGEVAGSGVREWVREWVREGVRE